MMRLAYILAASHSGSTLLSMLLGSHPQIATIGEMKLSPGGIRGLNCYHCSCGEFLRQNIVATVSASALLWDIHLVGVLP